MKYQKRTNSYNDFESDHTKWRQVVLFPSLITIILGLYFYYGRESVYVMEPVPGDN